PRARISLAAASAGLRRRWRRGASDAAGTRETGADLSLRRTRRQRSWPARSGQVRSRRHWNFVTFTYVSSPESAAAVPAPRRKRREGDSDLDLLVAADGGDRREGAAVVHRRPER